MPSASQMPTSSAGSIALLEEQGQAASGLEGVELEHLVIANQDIRAPGGEHGQQRVILLERWAVGQAQPVSVADRRAATRRRAGRQEGVKGKLEQRSGHTPKSRRPTSISLTVCRQSSP